MSTITPFRTELRKKSKKEEGVYRDETIQDRRLQNAAAKRLLKRLPTAVATDGSAVGSSETTTTTTSTTPATTTTTAAAAAPATTTATTSVADHLSETGIDLLLSLSENSDQVASLLGVCKKVVRKKLSLKASESTYCQW